MRAQRAYVRYTSIHPVFKFHGSNRSPLPVYSGLTGAGPHLAHDRWTFIKSETDVESGRNSTCHQHFSNNVLGLCKHSSIHSLTLSHTHTHTHIPSVSAGLCYACNFSVDFRAKCQCVPLFCWASCSWLHSSFVEQLAKVVQQNAFCCVLVKWITLKKRVPDCTSMSTLFCPQGWIYCC